MYFFFFPPGLRLLLFVCFHGKRVLHVCDNNKRARATALPLEGHYWTSFAVYKCTSVPVQERPESKDRFPLVGKSESQSWLHCAARALDLTRRMNALTRVSFSDTRRESD